MEANLSSAFFNLIDKEESDIVSIAAPICDFKTEFSFFSFALLSFANFRSALRLLLICASFGTFSQETCEELNSDV